MNDLLCGSVPRAEALSPKRSRNAELMHNESADEAGVVMKRKADEGMVTCLRVTLSESTTDGKDERWNMLTWIEVHDGLSP